MNEDAKFIEQVRQIVPGCKQGFIDELLLVRDEIAREVERDREGRTFHKPQVLEALSDMQANLEACIQTMEGRYETLRLGIDYLNQSLYQEYFDSGKADGHWLGYDAGLLNLQRVRDAVVEAKLNVDLTLPAKPLKMGVRTAAKAVCNLLSAHGYGEQITAYNEGLVCQVIGAVMDSLHSPRSSDSYRKEVEMWLHEKRAAVDPYYKGKDKILKAIQVALKGKPIPK